MEATDDHSAKVHDEIILALTSNQTFKHLQPYDADTIKKICNSPGTAIQDILAARSSLDINLSMVRFVLVLIAHQDHFPSIGTGSWTSFEPEFRGFLNTLVDIHGFNPRAYGIFYACLLVAANIITGARLPLDPHLPTTKIHQSFTLDDSTHTCLFIYREHWLPVRSAIGPPSTDDSRFQKACSTARAYVRTRGTFCAVTELGFGYLKFKVPVLVVATKPGDVLLQEQFDQPYVHVEEDFAELSSGYFTPFSESHEPEELLEEKILEASSLNDRDRMFRTICQDYIPPRDTADYHEIRLRKYSYRSSLYKLIENGVQRPQTGKALYHGASICPKDKLGRGSFGVYLFCEVSKPVVFYITAGHVAPHPSVIQAPSTLEMIKEPFARFRPNFEWVTPMEEVDELCRQAYERRQLVGETICSKMGVEVEEDGSWCVDFSLVKRSTEVHEAPANGFSHIKDLTAFAEKLFPAEAISGELEGQWWNECSVEELKRSFERIDGFVDTTPGGNDRVFKDGAATGLTTGVMNGRQVHLYLPTFADSRDGINHCKFDAVVCSILDKITSTGGLNHAFCAKGDAGSGTFKMVMISPGCWRAKWTGMLLTQWSDDKLMGALGLVVPASAVLRQLKRCTGQTFYPAP